MRRIAIATACLAVVLVMIVGCKPATAPLPPWAPNVEVATVGSIISSANATVNGYEQDQKDCAAKPSLTKCPGVSNAAIHAAVTDIQEALAIAQPQFNQWEAAIRQNPGETEPANLAAAISTIQAALAKLPSLTGK